MAVLSEKSRLGQKVVVRRMRRRRNILSRGRRWENRKRSRRASYGRVLYNYFRTYDPSTGRYLESDPIGLGGGLNTYGYVGGNPVRRIDRYGLWSGVDDAIFAGGGAIIGLAGRAIGDLITWDLSSWQEYAGAAVGGAVGGETLLYTANPFLAGAAAGLSANLTSQGLNILTDVQCEFNYGSAVFDTSFGAATGFIPGRPRIQGVNAGRGSAYQVFQQMSTKAANGQINNVSGQTAGKMAGGAFYEHAAGQGAAAGALGSSLWGQLNPSTPESCGCQ